MFQSVYYAMLVTFYALPIAMLVDMRIALVLWLLVAVLRFATVQRTLQAIDEQSTGSRIARIARAIDQHYENER